MKIVKYRLPFCFSPHRSPLREWRHRLSSSTFSLVSLFLPPTHALPLAGFFPFLPTVAAHMSVLRPQKCAGRRKTGRPGRCSQDPRVEAAGRGFQLQEEEMHTVSRETGPLGRWQACHPLCLCRDQMTSTGDTQKVCSRSRFPGDADSAALRWGLQVWSF